MERPLQAKVCNPTKEMKWIIPHHFLPKTHLTWHIPESISVAKKMDHWCSLIVTLCHAEGSCHPKGEKGVNYKQSLPRNNSSVIDNYARYFFFWCHEYSLLMSVKVVVISHRLHMMSYIYSGLISYILQTSSNQYTVSKSSATVDAMTGVLGVMTWIQCMWKS